MMSLMVTSTPTITIATMTTHVTAPMTHFRFARRRSVGDDVAVAPWACAQSYDSRVVKKIKLAYLQITALY